MALNNPLHGIYVLDKPKSLSSQRVLNSLKGVFQTKRIGHLGTLDPFATGVLPVFVGEMTKLIPYCEDSKKSYVAELKLGEETDTLDCTGEIIQRTEIPEIKVEQILASLEKLQGRRFQRAPMYSAIKIAGRPLYSYARKDKTPESSETVRQREVEIFRLELLDYQKPLLRFFCEVSRGTYVRSLGLEIAELLGTKGHLCNLRRTQSGLFTEEQALLPELFQNADADFLRSHQIPLKKLYSKVQHLELSPDLLERMLKGQWIKISELPLDSQNDYQSGLICFAYLEGKLAIIAEYKEKNGKKYLAPLRGIN
ncbi:MAG: tRNA pseudouridine(55) synthase TruB [Deltaproteobacteria bacterium]|nr:tRNA pseudouridine(55) synthase TruB [Deltaproteobacteria bacterium]